MELLKWDISQWWQYVPSKLNVADVLGRPDKVTEGRWFASRHKWSSVSARGEFLPVARLLLTRPQVAWGALHARLYGGRRAPAQDV